VQLFALATFVVFALADWSAVVRSSKPLEYVAKPAALAALVVYAAAEPVFQPWLIAALVLSLLGDVYLMLPVDLFVAGLASFLLAHLAYVATFAAPIGTRVAAAVAVALLTSPVAARVLRNVDATPVRLAVASYMLVIALMVGSAIASGNLVATSGAILFLVSDSLIAWNRFVKPFAGAQAAIMVTYHLAQLALTLALSAR
jgi:uncharacterized membrane protein YhhN